MELGSAADERSAVNSWLPASANTAVSIASLVLDMLLPWLLWLLTTDRRALTMKHDQLQYRRRWRHSRGEALSMQHAGTLTLRLSLTLVIAGGSDSSPNQ